MREISVPPSVTVADGDTAVDAVFRNAEEAPSAVCFRRDAGGTWQDVTCRQFRDEVVEVARGLVAKGVSAGDRVGLMSPTRYEWTLCDYAIWAAGGVTVPIYETSSAEQVNWYLGNSEAVAAFCAEAEHRDVVAEGQAGLGHVKDVWTWSEGALEELKAAGADVPESQVLERVEARRADDLATIIYTSGTTGRPKGCELTHRNIVFDTRATTEGLRKYFHDGGSTLLFLPLAHVFARLIQVGCVENRVAMGHTSDIKNLVAELQTFQPTFLLSVPRVFEKVYNNAKQKAHAEGKGRIFDWAEGVAVSYSRELDEGGPGLLTRPQHLVADKLVFSKLRAALGGQIEGCISGGAPLGERLGHFFRGVGIPIYEGYGLTETSAGATVNLQDAAKIGTVGKPLPGVSVKIDGDGEVLVRGDNVFRGYHQNEDATKETFSQEWFKTGDLGTLDDEGFLKIVGRKKELIVTAGGKNVSPAVLEDGLRSHPIVSQCIVVGDQRPFIACLVTLDAEALPTWLENHDKDPQASPADLVDDPDVRAAVQEAVDKANKAVSKAEAIKAFTILPDDFTVEGGQLTPSMKLKRNVVMKERESEIAGIYG